MPLEMGPYKQKGVYKLKTVDDINQALEDHQVQLSSMKSTKFELSKILSYRQNCFQKFFIFHLNFIRFVEPFATQVDFWERAISTVGEVLEMVLIVQRGYVYLDNIFSAEDIRKQLPKETEDFDQLTITWGTITSRMAAAALVLPATQKPRQL